MTFLQRYARTYARTYARDLAMGARFAVTGGRAGWLRTALTAAGVGIGVALLLVLAALPEAVDAREARQVARHGGASAPLTAPGARTMLIQQTDTEYRGRRIEGSLVRPEGPKAPVPPGVAALPRPGEMVVSPALKDLLDSPAGALLRERLPHRVTGTIAAEGLVGPDELLYYASSDKLAVHYYLPTDPHRIDSFGHDRAVPPPNDDVKVLGGLACAVVLLPVGVLIATAARFGGERRDRRLAALRLLGADSRTTRRVAAGEALAGALFGLVVGGGLFLLLRQGGPSVRLDRVGIFPADLLPSLSSAVVIAVAVPLVTVAVSLFALRDVAIEPLGVVRGAPRRRRLWWRPLLPLAGLVLLVGIATNVLDLYVAGYKWLLVPAAAVLVLLGVTALLPWLVQAVVGRLQGGAPAWQLAVRRLQLDSGPASRAVVGILVAVAGAVSVQMVFDGARAVETTSGGGAAARSVYVSTGPGTGERTRSYVERFRGIEGVRAVAGHITATVDTVGTKGYGRMTIADCDSARVLAKVDACRDGDVFLVTERPGTRPFSVRPGMEVTVRDGRSGGEPWTVPASARVVDPQAPDGLGYAVTGILATPSAVRTDVRDAQARITVRLDPGAPDAVERVRNTVATIDPAALVIDTGTVSGVRDSDYVSLLRLLPAGTALTLALIAASLTLATVEQLGERRSALSVLAAFGAGRSVVVWSVVWQTAVPVVLGMLLAVAFGLGLGRLVMTMTPLRVADWFGFVPIVGTGLGVVALVTLAALPALWRMMRPDGLRAE
ncbi:FtsX-like permease family protein [Streptomyces sp. NPDC049585]|uniref:FtsX-like permease family protein n=1 Tax=Streptomyces sp. NPDC049585 TaxID=3155154 RepID=UPI00342FA088